ncbi:hypothetical protein [Hymenobacter sp. B81]|uniref:hypothetical protein n=1 Tax=Hymenobacter sp. B81 TaxID=3344878 RepID=UPI0037DC3CB0
MKVFWKQYDVACACADLSTAALRTQRETSFHQDQAHFWAGVKRELRAALRNAETTLLLGSRPVLPG